MKIIVKFCAVTALLAGCETVDISQPPIMVTPKNASSAIGVDVYGKERARGGTVPRFRGQDTITVRTFGQRESNGYGEIPGASCKLDSDLYTAAFQTPANIVVPDYGPNSPAIFVQCTAGDKSKSETYQPVNLTFQERNASAASGGILGALIITAVNESRRDNETDDFGYNPMTLQLE